MTKKTLRIENCRWCGKPTTEFYIIADDLENPKPYHKECARELMIKVLADSQVWEEEISPKRIRPLI